MKRQVFLPIVHENPYFCFPEAVGCYNDEPQHCAIREKNEFDSFNLHVVISGRAI